MGGVTDGVGERVLSVSKWLSIEMTSSRVMFEYEDSRAKGSEEESRSSVRMWRQLLSL